MCSTNRSASDGSAKHCSLSGGMLVCRAEGAQELLSADRGAAALFECGSAEELREWSGGSLPGLIHPEDRERALGSLRAQFSDAGQRHAWARYRIVTKSGRTRRVEHFGHLLPGEDGRAVCCVCLSELGEEAESDGALCLAQTGSAEGRRAGELKCTISSLLDNMPGMSFTKDAETGVYLACNQAFARYAHKDTPDGVVGLTDAEIFDAQTAAHFVEDDRVALSMDKPYIFFEDVPDAAGSQRQFQTTKMKYTDAAGRLCLQGMCQDVTDMVRIQRENATTREAYEAVRSNAIIYTHIAQALARGYTDLYYVNMETDELIEFHTDDECGVLTEVRRSADFFEGCERDVKLFVHPDDQEAFVRAMNRDFLNAALDRQKVFELTYRRIKAGRTFYVEMRVSRIEQDRRFIVIAVSDIDELMRKRLAEERIREERIIYARLHAITGNFLVVYVVDPTDGSYREFSATADYSQSFSQATEGTDFFSKVRDVARSFNHPADLSRFLTAFTKENVMGEIERSGIFTLTYRLMVDGKPTYVQLKAAMVEEKDGERLIVGLNDIDAQMRQEKEYSRRLAQAQAQANLDALTGIRNKHAYLEAEARMDRQIASGLQGPFAIVMLDVNDLKKVNDTEGHQYGDQYLCEACSIICDIFRPSPVFRVGGDEFAVIAEGSEYEHIEERIERQNRHNAEALRSGGIVIACGMAKYENDSCVAAAFERADHEMYKNKSTLKKENE